MQTFVIAEAGANHNRDWKLAKKLIYAAAAAGASAVKFQNYTSEKLYTSTTPNFGIYKDIPKLISSIELPKNWCVELKKICDDCDIEFMSTPFDEEAVELLHNVGVKKLKVAAFEAADTRLMKCVAQTGLPIIFSAGIKTGLHQVRSIVDFIKSVNSNADITVLHCNSSYPTPVEDINLGQMLLLKNTFKSEIKVGLSDHTNGILIPPIAVSHGAVTIEKHFTMSRQLQGPDHPFAIEPNELVEMCRNISMAEKAMGTKDDNSLTQSEKTNEMFFALRSIVAKTDIKAGDVLSENNTTTKRPYIEGNLPASQYYEVVENYVATQNISADTMIQNLHIKRR
jgi:sialic acid synthase SpsE